MKKNPAIVIDLEIILENMRRCDLMKFTPQAARELHTPYLVLDKIYTVKFSTEYKNSVYITHSTTGEVVHVIFDPCHRHIALSKPITEQTLCSILQKSSMQTLLSELLNCQSPQKRRYKASSLDAQTHWISAEYTSPDQIRQGVYFYQDYRKTECIPQHAKGFLFSYISLCSDEAAHSIDIEFFHKAQTEDLKIYLTRMIDLGSIAEIVRHTIENASQHPLP